MVGSNYSDLNKTWIFDLDGTLLKHNGYKNGGEELLPGVKDFFSKISKDDRIVILTARDTKYQQITEKFLNDNGIRFDHIIYDLPIGERILFNDKKPSGLKTAYAYNLDRDSGL
ncbi:3' phosphatase [Synechococcus phage S-SRM01]|uniref:3' phosphatase n=1 Tax=Synechococcus phage S-SRM01 TaxID=2781608 RepID=A0A879R3C8_9CAUD|nr:3' phosphatase [Synechococcus phage S-SRM01]QPX48267.1 3' phosphatase [Synechococcus phage S-SRM01]